MHELNEIAGNYMHFRQTVLVRMTIDTNDHELYK
jgi:hypothetical protein